MLGFGLVIAYCIWEEILNKTVRKPPKTYDDLMKLPSFTEDEHFQQQLKDREDEVG